MIPVVIVGLGRIGAGNVELAGDPPMSHVTAVRATERLSIIGLVDSDPAARQAVLRNHPGLSQEVLASDISELPPDTAEVIAICTPPETHAELLTAALARRPRVVILEKPLAPDLATAQSMVAAAERSGTALRINFHRRFDRRHQRWRKNAPVRPCAIVMRYGKGLFNYASHMVDLLFDWYGPVETVQALGPVDAASADPNLSFRCRMRAGFDAVIIGIDGLTYDQFEIDIFGTDARLEISAGGAEMRWHRPVSGLHYRGYRHLAEEERDIGPVAGYAEMYAAVEAHLRDGRTLSGCNGAVGLANVAVLDAVLRSAAASGVAVTPAISLPEAA